jgi:predicted transcriptional regulator
MKHIYTAHQLAKQLTIDDILDSHNVTHEEYRKWLRRNKLPMYAMTKGLYHEAQNTSEDPRRTHVLTRYETQKVLYTSHWTEKRDCMTDIIAEHLAKYPNASQESIAYELNVTQARVSQVARANDLRPRRKKRTHIPLEKIRELSHKSPEEIARLTNLSLSTVYKKLAQCKNI